MDCQVDKFTEQTVSRNNVFATLKLIETCAKDVVLPQVMRLDTTIYERNRAELLVLVSTTIEAMKDAPRSQTFNFSEMKKSSDPSIQRIYEKVMPTLGMAVALNLSFWRFTT